MFDITRIQAPLYFEENRLPAHSDHRWFASVAEAVAGVSSFEQCLDGLWKFHYARNFAETIHGFESPDDDCDSWDDIPVPAHIQLHGYDRPQYVNSQYPWDGYEQIEPGQVPTRYNPVGSYVTTFELDQPLADGERLALMFHGAESGIAVWVNGTYIGYGEDSFTPSEFDITDALVEGENKVAAQVFKWTSGSWLEDQDMYRFSGIFRSVMLYRRPACHAEDIKVTCRVAEDCLSADLDVWVALAGEGAVRATLLGVGDLESIDDRFTLHMEAPHLWSSEDPYLYDLQIEVYDAQGALTECVPLNIGARRFGIEDGVLKINGERIVFKGVNRHDFGLAGRAMTRERAEEDVKIIKAAGCNAVRTCHYPNGGFFYDLCDEYGLYVIDEMNLETHGMWDLWTQGRLPIEEALPGDRPDWLPALLDRAANLYQRDKNHTSVIMWSCGNESLGGRNIFEVSQYFRGHDDTRPVHYEGVHYDPRYPETSDIGSDMYLSAEAVEEHLKTYRDKPFILCEYAHTMGNSFGAVDKYLDLADREPLFQGGFIWDFADQAIALKDRYDQPYFGYGGDCGDAPSDYEFCGNGIVFADHSLSPKVQEVRHVYQNLRMRVRQNEVSVTNKCLFTNSSEFECVAVLAREGEVLSQGTIGTDVAPGQTVTYPLPFTVPASPGEYTIDVCFVLRDDTAWAPAGHEVATEQLVLVVEGEAVARTPVAPPELIDGIHNIGVRGRHFTALFSRINGGLVSYRFGLTRDGGHELLKKIPMPNFWHAPTSNERGWNMGFRDGQWALASRYPKFEQSADNPSFRQLDDSVEVTFRYTLPTTPASTSVVTYRVFASGRVEVTVTATPGEGLPDMPEFGMMMVMDADFHRVRWYGEGPEECYIDRRGGARLGVYDGEVTEQLTEYLRPQEAGSHTGVRWATVTNDQGRGMRFERLDGSTSEGLPATGGMEFSALPWTPFEIESAAHHTELPLIHHTVLRPALVRRGVGGDNSWGSMTHPEYRVPGGQLTFRFAFQGIR